jgi:hypothetical protein
MKARVAAFAVIALLTLSAVAVGFSALGEAQDAAAASTKATERTPEGDNVAVSAFKFVCPFH